MDLLVWIFLLVLGTAGGFLVATFSGTGRKTKELQKRLEDKQAELDDYRREVFDQFGATAQKFKALNDSYVDLHQQLARSASLLCGDMGAEALLEAPLTVAITDEADTTDTVTNGENGTDDGESTTVVDASVEFVDGDVANVDGDVASADRQVPSVDGDAPGSDQGVSPADEEVTGVEPEMASMAKDEVPTLEISQMLEDDDEADNSHWVSAMEEVLEKLKHPARESMDQVLERKNIGPNKAPLRNAS